VDLTTYCINSDRNVVKRNDLSSIFFFRVVPRRGDRKCQRFGNLCRYHLHRRMNTSMKMVPTEVTETLTLSMNTYEYVYEDGTDRGYRNVDTFYPHARKLPKRRKYSIFTTRRKLKN
jgi:hypothetical protein